MEDVNRSLKAFLCHASGDKASVQKLYSRLVNDGIDAWLDKEKLIPGQIWEFEIRKAVRNSDVVIICLSSQSITKEGFVQKEIKIALDAANEKPEGTIFIIPARLEDCNLPESISQFHMVDLFSGDGYKKLLKALQIRANTIGITIKSSKKERLSSPSKNEKKNVANSQENLGFIPAPKQDISTQLPSFNLLKFGRWNFNIAGNDWKGTKEFYIVFNQDGTLKYKNSFSDANGTSGVWRQHGTLIHFEIGHYSVWDGTINGTKMIGTVSNNDKQFGTWNAEFQP